MRAFAPTTIEDALELDDAPDTADPRYVGLQRAHPNDYINTTYLATPKDYGNHYDSVRRELWLRMVGIYPQVLWLEERR